jgi:hypothetical protein
MDGVVIELAHRGGAKIIAGAGPIILVAVGIVKAVIRVGVSRSIKCAIAHDAALLVIGGKEIGRAATQTIINLKRAILAKDKIPAASIRYMLPAFAVVA